MQKYLQLLINFIIFCLFLGGIFFHLDSNLLPFTLWITESLLWLINILALIAVIIVNKLDRQRLQIWILICAVATFLLEIIGTNTGLIFGNYNYGTVFYFQFFGTPLLIGLKWVVVILGSVTAAKFIIFTFLNKLKVIENPESLSFIFLVSFLASLVATLFDWFLEPVAIKLGYWSWDGGFIPFTNYLAWFIITFVFSFFLYLMKIKLKPSFLFKWFWLQFLFIAIINLFMVRLEFSF